MVALTRGAVWQAELTEERFAEIRSKARIVHHLRDGDRIRARLLAPQRPLPEAEEVTPTLEDSYLWLLEGEGADESGHHAGGEVTDEGRGAGVGA